MGAAVIENFNQIPLPGFGPLYFQALKEERQSIVFEIQKGIGRFVFMIFFDENDKNRNDFFLLLGRTQQFREFQLYGSHKKSETRIFLNGKDVEAVRKELDIQAGGKIPFDAYGFMRGIAKEFPHELTIVQSMTKLREYKKVVMDEPRLDKIVPSKDKRFFLHPMSLPEDRRPREPTLRKLYLNLDAEPRVIERFILWLKRQNKTVKWTDQEQPSPNLQAFING